MKRLILCLLMISGSLSSCLDKDSGLNFGAQLSKDTATIDAYLAEHSITATKDSSGVRYLITAQGTGAKPAIGSFVSVKFVGHLLPSGDVFNQSDGVSLNLGNLILGWQIALPLINKGSKFTLYVPSGLAYGPPGNSVVPPNANLYFEIELIDDDALLIEQVADLDAFLTDSLHLSEDTIHKNPGGIRYVYSVKGTGARVSANGAVNMTYKGKTIPDLTVFVDHPATAQVFVTTDILTGLQIGLPLFPAGSEVSLYIPSVLAYGLSGSQDGKVDPNTAVVFEIKVISVN